MISNNLSLEIWPAHHHHPQFQSSFRSGLNRNPHLIARQNAIQHESFRIKKKKRALNGNPIQTYVEVLVVTDTSVLANFQKLANSTDPSVVFSNMRLYYAYAFNAVNQRFANSLGTDPDLRINVAVKNFLFVTVSYG